MEGQGGINEKRRQIGNISLLVAVFMLTTAYFHFYSWYSLLAPYGTLTAALFLIVTFFCYVDIGYALRDPAFYLMVFCDALALINLFVIGSHKGAILTVADFILILYLANKVVFSKKEMIISSLYIGVFFIYWTIDVKGYFKGYNTNYGGLVLISGFIFLIYALEYFFHGFSEYEAGNGIRGEVGNEAGGDVVNETSNSAGGDPGTEKETVTVKPEANKSLSIELAKASISAEKVPSKNGWRNSFVKLCIGTNKYQRLLRVLEVILFYIAFRIIAWYRSRCALVGLVVFLVLLLIPKNVWKNKVLYGILVFAGTVGSILFSAFYVWLGVMKEELTLRLFYKDIISGREEIWAELWEEYLKKPFTGIGSSYVMKLEWMEGLFEVHSGLLDILIVHGLVVFIIVCTFLVFRLWAIRETVIKSYAARAAMAGIFAMLFTAFMENYIIVAPFSLMFLFLFAYINKWNKDDRYG